jgi:AraC-like DNA-binding protein
LKSALQKSPIPLSRAYVAKVLDQAIFDPNWHFHSEYQLFLVLKGSGTRFIGDNIKPFKAGDITFTGPNLPHLWRSDHEPGTIGDRNATGIVVYFHEDLIGEHLLHKEEAIRLKQLFKMSLRGVDVFGKTAQTLQKMLVNLIALDGFDAIIELMKILNCISQSNELKLLASPGYTNSLKEGDTDRMNRVYAHVMKNFQKKMAISQMAELTNLTPTSFSRYFKAHANKTFTEFVTEIRIGHACKLLIENKMEISQSCYESGFHTLSNFNRHFKRITKRTPLLYKREYTNH